MSRILSLCTGYGGLDRAVEQVTGAQTVAVSDIDPGANKILAHSYPDVPNLGDLKRIDWEAWAGVEIMTAGYPCQPFSHAGKRAGTDDPRHIFPDIIRGIRLVGPRLVVLENVRGHLVLGFDTVLGALADAGYDAVWTCIKASDVGACHRRERLFIVATPSAAEHPGYIAGSIQYGLQQEVPPEWVGQPDQEPADALTLLPTPAVNDMGAGKTVDAWDEWTDRMRAEHGNGNGHGKSLSIEALRLLKTPTAQLAVSGGSQHPDKRKAGGHGPTLADEVEHLLPTPRAYETGGDSPAEADRHSPGLLRAIDFHAQRWSVYEAAIRRHERALGRPAPSPTEVGPKGGRRLSPAFVEWMMMQPAGWVTSVPDLTRNEQLKALGNGVVTAQAVAALRWLLAQDRALEGAAS